MINERRDAVSQIHGAHTMRTCFTSRFLSDEDTIAFHTSQTAAGAADFVQVAQDQETCLFLGDVDSSANGCAQWSVFA